MGDDDFGIESLAAYLHVDPAQVVRLVERGKLPGRKVGGQWRFAQAEIHHWLEERIGLSSDEELVHMEGALRRAAGETDQPPISIPAASAGATKSQSATSRRITPAPSERE